MCNICKNNIAKMFLDFLLEFKIVHLIKLFFFFFFGKNSFACRISKTAGWIFTKICNAATSKLLYVQCKFMFKSDCKILRYGCFKVLAQACPGWGDGIDPEFFASSLYISVSITVRFFKFNMINRYKSNISKLVLVFSSFKIVNLKQLFWHF